jgi:ubiquinone biosynthesis protein
MGVFNYIDGKYTYLKRYNQIIKVLFRYGFEDLVSYMEEKKRFKFLQKLVPRSTYEHAMHLSKWEKMRLVCEELGPTFVKFGQIMSNRADILPAALVKELEKLQDNVPPVPGAIAWEIFEQELKVKREDVFMSFEQEPFASASMAQVHRATLKTGQKVAVKIQRAGIREMIQSDIKVMLYVAGIFSRRISSLKSFDPVGLVKNFEKSVTEELDFIHESINVQRFSNNIKEDKTGSIHIHCPAVYREYTSSKVLTLEFIEGVKITDLVALEKRGLDRKEVAKRLVRSYFKQIFQYGFFHADPHPGNLLVLPGNVVGIIDYGMMGSIMRKDIEQLAALYMAVRTKETRRIIRALQQLADTPVIKNYRQLESDLNEFVQNYSVNSIHQNELSTVLLELKDIIVRHNLKVPSHFFLLGRSMVTMEGVIKTLDPELDLVAEVRPFLVKTIAKHYNPLQFGKRILNSVYEIGMYLEDLPRDLKNAIRKINSGEVKVNLHHKGIDPLIHTVNRVSKQIVSAVIISGLIIGSSLLLTSKIPPLWDGTSAPGIIGLIIVGILTLGMLRDLRRGDHDDWSGWDEDE